MSLHRAILPPKFFAFENVTSGGLLDGQLMRISFECSDHLPSSWVGCYLMDVPGTRTYPLATRILHKMLGVANISTTEV